MLLSPFLIFSGLVGLALATTEEYRAACKVVETAISNASKVYYPGEHGQLPWLCGRANARTGDPLYIRGKYHFVASSEQDPACLVEPGTPEDVGEIVRPSTILHRSR
jgi:hypothetical protein